jgi:hypothetical protein|tara:strand:- start:1819 stop:2370 length:552 start_codon:yes stop_codon:yes gene_type:complete
MKNFKELANNIGLYESGEHTFGGGVQNPSATPREISAASDVGVFNIQRKSQLNRINAFLDSFSRKEYIDPRGAIAMLRAKLNIAGLDFDFTGKTCFSEDGENRFPINRFGGTFGKGLTTPFDEFDNTDGISDANDGKGFDLVITITTTANGVSKLNARLEETNPVAAIVVTPAAVDADETDDS